MNITDRRQSALAEKLGISREDLPDVVSRLKYLLTSRQYEALSGVYAIHGSYRTLSEIGHGWGTHRERPRQVADKACHILKWEVEHGSNLPSDPLDYTFAQLFIPSRVQAAGMEHHLLIRTYNALRNEYEYSGRGPSPMRWLTTQSEADLMRLPNSGRKSIDALIGVLKHAGLSLAG